MNQQQLFTKQNYKLEDARKLLKSFCSVPRISDFPCDAIAAFPKEIIFFVKVSVIFTDGYGKTFLLEIWFLLFTYSGFFQHLKSCKKGQELVKTEPPTNPPAGAVLSIIQWNGCFSISDISIVFSIGWVSSKYIKS